MLVPIWTVVARGQDRVDSSTLDHKFILGFQGWFACPGDGNPLGGWGHWFNGRGQATFDLLPDVSELPAKERCETGMSDRENRPVEVFSDQRYSTVLRQFEWMRENGLDGVALERFALGLGDPKRLARADRVLDNVRRAAEATGRVFFVQYDIAGADAAAWPAAIEADWLELMKTKKIVDSPAYLHHKGNPVVGVTGPGMQGDRPSTPEQTLEFLGQLRSESAAAGSMITLFGTVPRGWRTLTFGPRTEPGWAKVFRSFDVISPWVVGAMREPEDIDRYARRLLKPDLAEARRLGIDYMPVVFPGFSWSNLKNDPTQFNKFPRRCGRFAWEQATAYVSAGATMLFGAMFDEVDEGTAFFKLAPHADQSPPEPRFVSLDVDGCDLPSDWYLRVAGAISRRVKGEQAEFPR